MTSFYQASKKIARNPRKNYRKVIPYLKSISEPKIRAVFEFLNLESKSKPYPGHENLLEIIDFKNGLYVVCGGNDGYGFDPTYYLEKFRNWSGLIIEPLPQAVVLCKKNRSHSTIEQVALVSHDYRDTYIDLHDCNFMSVTSSTSYDIKNWISEGAKAQHITPEKISVRAKTLDSVLENHQITRKIDLLVIDVEGSEEDVMKGFNLKKYLPRFILIEMHTPELKQSIEFLLGDEYSLIKKTDSADYLYKLS